jgi:hypothetical protein
MEDTKRLCPLVKDECVEESCMWYVEDLDRCAINVIVRAIDDLADIAETKQND